MGNHQAGTNHTLSLLSKNQRMGERVYDVPYTESESGSADHGNTTIAQNDHLIEGIY